MPSPLELMRTAGPPPKGGLGLRFTIGTGNVVSPPEGMFLNGSLRNANWKTATVVGLIMRVQLDDVAYVHSFFVLYPYNPGTVPEKRDAWSRRPMVVRAKRRSRLLRL